MTTNSFIILNDKTYTCAKLMWNNKFTYICMYMHSLNVNDDNAPLHLRELYQATVQFDQ